MVILIPVAYTDPQLQMGEAIVLGTILLATPFIYLFCADWKSL